ncbi:MAG: hypothetical protein HY534_06785 [Chloroflexi bacterium]|nr:hypothetical protein [Chloroflexota bacterium]
MIQPRVILAGLIASMVMGMVAMIYEAVAGAGFWAPVVFISATVLRDLQSISTPIPFLALPVVLGLMGHMMNSVILGIGYSKTLGDRFRGLTAGTVAGGGFGLLVFAAMWVIVLPLVDPVMLRLNAAAFAVAHLMWGGAIGLALNWRTSEATGTQGYGAAH